MSMSWLEFWTDREGCLVCWGGCRVGLGEYWVGWRGCKVGLNGFQDVEGIGEDVRGFGRKLGCFMGMLGCVLGIKELEVGVFD